MDGTVPHVMMTVVIAPDGDDPIADAACVLGVATEAIDSEYGCLLIDPEQHLHVVMVDPYALPVPHADEEGDDHRGPFSNPRIETFGPPQGDASA